MILRMNIYNLIDEGVWETLPEEPDAAFTRVVNLAQARADERFIDLRRIAEDHDNERPDYTALQDAQYGFMSSLIGVAKGFEVSAFESYHLPAPGDFDNDYFRRFTADLNHFLAQHAARSAVRSRQLSVKLDGKPAQSVRAYVVSLRDAVDAANLSDSKKAALNKKLEEFQNELDGGNRISLLKVTRLAMEILAVPGGLWASGEVVAKLTTNIIQSFGEAKAVEDEAKTALLPAPDQKAITGPTYEEPKPSRFSVPRESYDLNDDIPF